MGIKRDDYILEQIEKFGILLRGLFGIKNVNDFKEEMNKISKVTKEDPDIEFEFFDGLTEEGLYNVLKDGNNFSVLKWKLIAAYLNRKAEEAADYEDFLRNKSKSLMILMQVYFQAKNIISMDLLFQIDQMIAELEDRDISPTLSLMLFDFFYLNCRWASAENMLFKMLGQFSDKGKLKELGRDFYKGLEKKSESELKEGDFTREEIITGWRDLENF